MHPFRTKARLDGRCRVCGQPVPPERAGLGICGNPVCQTRATIEAASAEVKRKAEERDAAEAKGLARVSHVIEATAAQAGEPDLDRIATGVVPHITLTEVPQEEEQLERFETNLGRAIAEALGEEEAPEWLQTEAEGDPDFVQRAEHQQGDPLSLDAACIACRGDCCMQGNGRDAFINMRTIQWYLRQNPEAGKEEIRQDYLSRLPEAHIERSCVYHTNTGCALPREMRADVCNRWECRWRDALRGEIRRKGAARSAVVGLPRDHDDHPEEGGPRIRAVAIDEHSRVAINDGFRAGPLK
ncbi:hypothetical protein RM543_04210 [Roseicyclus sp. F158]|uniref:Uncharacterized protein n=1 Tax=Tropicimonas omnivorans TaxID=3075590 RepID=A0ABU3DDU1_9RHOB|nr:hypothetical protein [Roseicyclus sp. F158]MDT0681879.1 hypothetical protein [Roseicyclus sp. F158]